MLDVRMDVEEELQSANRKVETIMKETELMVDHATVFKESNILRTILMSQLRLLNDILALLFLTNSVSINVKAFLRLMLIN